MLLGLLSGVAVAQQTQQTQLAAELVYDAVIDLRAYATCSLLGASSTGGLFKSGFGTLVKTPVYIDESVVWKCTGQGITNQSGNDVLFVDFGCIIIDSAGILHKAVRSKASLTASGAEVLSCAYNLT